MAGPASAAVQTSEAALWRPGLRCSFGEKVMPCGLTPTELRALVSGELDSEAVDPSREPPPAPAPSAAAPPPALESGGSRHVSLQSLRQLEHQAALLALQGRPISALATEEGEMALEPATPMHAEVRTSLELPTSGEVQAVDGGAPPTPAAAATAAATAASSCSQSGSSRSRFESINRVAAVAGREYSVRRSGEKQRRSEERQRRGLGSRQQGGGVSRQSVPARQQQPWSHAPAVEGTAAARLAAAPLPAAPEFDIRRHVAAWVAASAAAASSAPPGEGPDQAWAPASSHGSNSDGWERAAAAAAMAAEVTALPKSCPPSRTSPQRIASAPAVEPPKSPPSSSPKKEGGTASRSLAHSSSAGALLGGACSGAGGATSEKPGSGGGKDICSRCNPIAALARLLRL